LFGGWSVDGILDDTSEVHMTTKSYAEYSVVSGFAVITLDNPPVNALSPALTEELYAAIERGERDQQCEGLILTGSGSKFSGGFDITQFGKPVDTTKKNLLDVIKLIDRAKKPVVAAIDGIALGGGLEVALACDYRCTSPKSSVGLPEIKLGIFPGAQGTQRLPRLIGVAAALEVILTGEPVPARKAKELGIVDEIIEGDFVPGAIAFAKQAIAKQCRRKVSEMKAEPNPEAIAQARRRAPSLEMGGLANHLAIDAIEAASTKSFDEGAALELKLFAQVVESDQAKARIHLFFAERNLSKIPDLSANAHPKAITSAAVLGAGTMGHGITMNFASVGIPVTMIDTTDELVKKGFASIEKNYQLALRKGRLTQEEFDKRIGAVKTATDYSNLADADIVVEAVFEDMAIKKEVFKKLGEACRPDAILASNTSTLDIDEIASVATNPERVIGLHFFSPANIMKLLEIVRGKKTSHDTIATAMQLARTIKKIGVLVGNCDGFVGNRMIAGYVREAELLLEEGASAQQVDKAIQKFGFAMGPFAMSDLAGVDVGYRVRKEREKRGPIPFRLSNISTRLFEMGRYGQKTGAGYYKYEENSHNPIPDPVLDEIILDEAKKYGIERKPISDEVIVKRLIYPLINEGAKILKEGIALRSSDIDIIYIYGYGFPAFRGGPMFYADTVGLQSIYDDIVAFEKADGTFWKPAPLLEELAQSKKRFAEYKESCN
jgi:3-hydroxyacyl-CoA dehydrogenase